MDTISCTLRATTKKRKTGRLNKVEYKQDNVYTWNKGCQELLKRLNLACASGIYSKLHNCPCIKNYHSWRDRRHKRVQITASKNRDTGTVKHLWQWVDDSLALTSSWVPHRSVRSSWGLAPCLKSIGWSFFTWQSRDSTVIVRTPPSFMKGSLQTRSVKRHLKGETVVS